MYAMAGTYLDVPYAVRLDPDRPGDVGCVTGSANIATLLGMYDGDEFQLAPTGGEALLDVNDPWSVSEFLIAHTSVAEVVGAAPTPPEDTDLPATAIV